MSQASQHFRSSEKQATCEGCFARQSVCSVVSLHTGMSRAVHPQEFRKVDVDHRNIPVQASVCINLLYLFCPSKLRTTCSPFSFCGQLMASLSTLQAVPLNRPCGSKDGSIRFGFFYCVQPLIVAPETKTQHRHQKQETKKQEQTCSQEPTSSYT